MAVFLVALWCGMRAEQGRLKPFHWAFRGAILSFALLIVTVACWVFMRGDNARIYFTMEPPPKGPMA